MVAVAVRVEVLLADDAFGDAFDPEVFDDVAFDVGGTDLLDVVAGEGLQLHYGIDGNGPTDCLASTGELTFALRNDAGNSGGVQGWYSPGHPSCRAGWTFGIPVRVVFTYGGVDYTKFRGKIRVIEPDAGQYRSQRVRVTAYDAMRDIMEADARAVTLQTDKTEAELQTEILDALESTAQPVARDMDTGVDTYPYAFDDLGSGVKAGSLLRDVVQSAYGLAFVKGDGTFCYRNRRTRASGSSAYTFNDSMHGLSVPSSLDGVFNRVRVTIHPKVPSATATDELYVLPTGSVVDIPSGATREVWTEYSDPDNRQTAVGGEDVVTVLVAGTHYSANSAADGGGSDLTSSITAALTPFGSTAKWALTNSAAVTAYIRTLTVVGKAVRDPGPQTFEAFTAQDYGDRPVSIDMPYQDDSEIARNAALFIQAQYQSLDQQVDSLEFIANKSDTFMTQALTLEPGDLISVTEPVTGLSAVEAVIHRVELTVTAGPIVMCRFGLAPSAPFKIWQLGVTGSCELGMATTLGF